MLRFLDPLVSRAAAIVKLMGVEPEIRNGRILERWAGVDYMTSRASARLKSLAELFSFRWGRTAAWV